MRYIMKKGIVLRVALISLLFLFSTANAAIWYVHPDSLLNSIQAGINSCSTGDTVLVAPGIYYENINFKGKAITVTSEQGANTTIIDGGNPANPDSASVVAFVSREDTNSVLKGFTITNGSGTYNIYWGLSGGGIYCDSSSSPTITSNIITGNTALYGGGIECIDSSSPNITGNTITNNRANVTGGGIDLYDYCSPLIEGDTITGNTAFKAGGGICCDENSSATIKKNFISGNTADEGGGIGCGNSSFPIITDNTITDNTANVYGGGIRCRESSPIIENCTISSNNGEGVYCKVGANPIINYNNITDNTSYGVYNEDSDVIINALHNWWGEPSGPYHPITNPSGLGDSVSNYVDFVPWLLEAGIGEQEPDHNVFFISQGKPNPFIDRTVIEYSLPRSCDVLITVYNLIGAKIKTLLNERRNAGTHTITWDGRDEIDNKVPSGFYFLRIEAGKYEGTRKLLLMR